MKKLLAILLMLFAFTNNSNATHLMGGEITWECIKTGPDAGFYIFTVKVYRDCQGVSIDTNMFLTVHNVPSLTTISLTYIGANDLSPTCDTINGPNAAFSCGSANVWGAGNGNGAVEEHIYTSAPIRIIGTPDANGWHFTWSSCCRNAAITNLVINGGSNPIEGFTLRAVMYSYIDSMGVVFPNTDNCYDSSPKFFEKPRTILEVGNGYDPFAFSNGFTYSHNAFDEEQDSISYTWGQPIDGFNLGYDYLNPNSTALPFSAPYSYTSPINGIVLNPISGRTWYPANQAGNFVTCTNVSAYKCNQLVAEIFREVQVVLMPPICNLGDTTSGNIGADTLCNIRPLVQPPFFYPASSSPYQWDTIVHCGDTVSFDFIANDNDVYPNGSQQDLQFTVSGGQFYDYNNNILCQNPPCATFNEIGTGNTPPFITAGGTGTGYFEWITSCNHIVNSCAGPLRPSTYTFVIKVQDDFCPAPAIENTSQVISITVYPPCGDIKANAVVTLESFCGAGDGSIVVSPNNGFSPYISYFFDMNGIPVNPNALFPGDYQIRITDVSLCEMVDTITVPGTLSIPSAIISATAVSCFGFNDGTATETVSGGTAPYDYVWSNGATTLSSTLTSDTITTGTGTYTCNITDSNGCSTSTSITITQPTAALIAPPGTSTIVTCFGYNDGTAIATVSGGTAPYNYVWSNGATTLSSLLTSDTITTVAGAYTCNITDINGCSTSTSITITQSASLLVLGNPSSTAVTCNGGADGTAIATVSGGTAPYDYVWSNGATTLSSTLTSDTITTGGGAYTISVTDANACTMLQTVTITEPLSLSPTLISSSNTLTGNSGGGTQPYTFEFWGPTGFVAASFNNFGTSFSINPLQAGNYTFIVVDVNGCSDSALIMYSTNFTPTVTVSLSNTDCDSLADLTITVSQDSGEVDMSTALFQSNDGYFDITSMNLGDTIGTASFMANGGSININTYLIVSSIISSSQAIIQACSSTSGCLGSFIITNTLGGGIDILSQTIPDGNNYTSGNMSSATFTNVFVNPCVPLVFTSTINSELGDVDIQTFNFIISGINELNTVFKIYPNPVTNLLNVVMNQESSDFTISIYDVSGKIIFSNYQFNNSSKATIDVSHLSSSIYMIVITGDKNIESKIFYKE